MVKCYLQKVLVVRTVKNMIAQCSLKEKQSSDRDGNEDIMHNLNVPFANSSVVSLSVGEQGS